MRQSSLDSSQYIAVKSESLCHSCITQYMVGTGERYILPLYNPVCFACKQCSFHMDPFNTQSVSLSRTLTSSKLSYYAFTIYGYIINACSTFTYHLSADQKLQSFLLELLVCIRVVARYIRHIVSITNLSIPSKMRKK